MNDGEDVASVLLKAIAAASPARADFYSLATIKGVEGYPSPPQFPGIMGSIALAHKLVRVEPNDNPQPLYHGRQAVNFLGRLVDREQGSLVLADYVRGGGRDGLIRLLRERRGPYAAIVAEEGRLLCCRDVLGVVPLYYGISDDLACVASNMRTIHYMGLEPKRVVPGRVYEMRPSSYIETEVARLWRPKEVQLSLDEAVNGLSVRLMKAAERAIGANPYPILAFSGGIDSTLLAFHLDRAGARLLLSCVAAEGLQGRGGC